MPFEANRLKRKAGVCGRGVGEAGEGAVMCFGIKAASAVLLAGPGCAGSINRSSLGNNRVAKEVQTGCISLPEVWPRVQHHQLSALCLRRL